MGFDAKQLVRDRDAAFTAFVMEDDWYAILQYCATYNVLTPDNPDVLAAGVYKAVQVIRNMPDAVKVRAAVKAVELGFSPYMMSHGDRSHDS